jgi:hypothetical protein
MRRALAAVAGAALVAMVACTVMNDLHLPRAASTDGGGGNDGGTCILARPPPRQDGGRNGGSPGNDIAFAFRAINNGPRTGYDLDGVCTCAPHPESCTPIGDAGHCDSEEGRDNGSGELVDSFPVFNLIEYSNDRIAAGIVGLLVLVEDYNGEENDTEITVSVFGSAGPERADAGPVRPKFDGSDLWVVNRLHVLGGGPDPPPIGRSLYTAPGYVANGELVVPTIDLPFALSTGSLTIFQRAILSARITREENRPTIRTGIVAARWPMDDLIAAVGAADFVSGEALCTNPDYPVLARESICPLADIMMDPSADGRGARCNAVSINFGFDAVPARFGPLGDVEVVTKVCDRSLRCDP